jgi:myo-inositol-1(or 4)-monophosphatase
MELMSIALSAAEAGARVAMRWLDQIGDLEIEEKTGPRDLVSRADRDTEDAIIAALREARPDDGVVGEERGEIGGTSDVEWAVDPIDGTTNYVYRRPDWAVSVAAMRRSDQRVLAAAVCEPMLGRATTASCGGGAWSAGRPVTMQTKDSLDQALIEINLGREEQRAKAGAMIDALAVHTRDIRRGGSAASALAQLATGRADAVWAPGLQAWDGAGGLLLVQEAGGMVGDLTGPTPGYWPRSGDVLAAASPLWEPLRQLLSPIYGHEFARLAGGYQEGSGV